MLIRTPIVCPFHYLYHATIRNKMFASYHVTSPHDNMIFDPPAPPRQMPAGTPMETSPASEEMFRPTNRERKGLQLSGTTNQYSPDEHVDMVSLTFQFIYHGPVSRVDSLEDLLKLAMMVEKYGLPDRVRIVAPHLSSELRSNIPRSYCPELLTWIRICSALEFPEKNHVLRTAIEHRIHQEHGDDLLILEKQLRETFLSI